MNGTNNNSVHAGWFLFGLVFFIIWYICLYLITELEEERKKRK